MKRTPKLLLVAGTVIALGSGLIYAGTAVADGDDDRCHRGGYAMMKGGHHIKGGHMFGELRDFNAEDIETLVQARLLRHAGADLAYAGLTPTDRGTFVVAFDKTDGSTAEIEISSATGKPVSLRDAAALGMGPKRALPEAQPLPADASSLTSDQIGTLAKAFLLKRGIDDKLDIGAITLDGTLAKIELLTTTGVLVREIEVDSRTGLPVMMAHMDRDDDDDDDDDDRNGYRDDDDDECYGKHRRGWDHS